MLATAAAPAFAGDIGDPVATGCINHVTDITSSPIYDQYGDLLGYTQNYYSAYCNSNWARVYTNGGYTANLTVVACQNDDGSCSQPNPYYRTDTAAYSDMVVGTHVVCATGSITLIPSGITGQSTGRATSCQ